VSRHLPHGGSCSNADNLLRRSEADARRWCGAAAAARLVL